MTRYYQFKKICLGRDYLSEFYSNKFSLSEVANYSCMSQYHFSRVFTKTFGETPNKFVTRLRVKKAKNLLITKNFSVSKICEIVGYSSVSSFSSRFSKEVGMSPSQYRHKLRSLSNESRAFPIQAIPMCYAHNLFGAEYTDVK